MTATAATAWSASSPPPPPSSSPARPATLSSILPAVGASIGLALDAIATAFSQPMVQTGIKALFDGILTAVIALVIKVTLGLRTSEEEEVTGIDQTVHAETAYELGSGLGGSSGVLPGHAGVGASSTKVTS